MTPEQENELFKSIGSIDATQKLMLEALAAMKDDIDKSVVVVHARVDKTNSRIDKIDDKLTNLRVKQAAFGGAAGLFVTLIAELLKNGGS
ncbi:MAG: hypothetical protein HRU25_09920 [Psychrobium sp.]|nr:hypothetical protein [Psychrobium sp.]